MSPIGVNTREGIKKSNKIWYNGKQPTKTITFEDGKSYTFTNNHKLLVKTVVGEYIWARVDELSEGMEIASL